MRRQCRDPFPTTFPQEAFIMKKYNGAVIVCPKCNRLKKFGVWIEIPEDIAEKVRSGEIPKIPIECERCNEK